MDHVSTTALNKDNFASTIEGNDVVLIDFWAEWCGPCKRFSPIYEEAATRNGDVTFAKVDTEENQDLSAALEIQSIPTIMAFRGGSLVFRQSGLLNGKQLDDLIQQIKDLDMDALLKEQAEAPESSQA